MILGLILRPISSKTLILTVGIRFCAESFVKPAKRSCTPTGATSYDKLTPVPTRPKAYLWVLQGYESTGDLHPGYWKCVLREQRHPAACPHQDLIFMRILESRTRPYVLSEGYLPLGVDKPGK